METISDGFTSVERQATPTRALVSLVAMVIVLASGCSDADTTSTWCENYEAGARAVFSLYEIDPIDPVYEEALGAAEAAAEALNATEPPREIRDDWSAVTLGVYPDVEGRRSPSDVEDTLDRVLTWTESNCDFDRDFLVQLRSPFDPEE